ncbi:hypothetical protein M758_11G119400 [Ceratodon purpureus]|nr:hypothetical protein M758_11G119400 [Ceratodon purpureus]
MSVAPLSKTSPLSAHDLSILCVIIILTALRGSFQLADDLLLGLKQAELIQIYVLRVPGFQQRRIYNSSYMNVST